MKGYEGRQMEGDKAAAAAKSSPKWRSWRETYEGRQGNSGNQQQPRMEIMKGDKWREMKGDNAAAASSPFSDFGDQHGSHWEVRTPIASSYLGNEEGRLGAAAISVISMQGDKWRETNEEGRLGAAAISVISMQGDKWRETNEEGRFWESACRETNEGRQMKRRWFWESACRETKEGRQMKKGDFGNQHKKDKWRETNEEGKLGAAAISVISMQGDKWRRETRSGSDFGNQHAGRLGISTQGDKWRETNEEGRFWESARRETNEGRQLKRRWFWESARRETNEGRQMKKGDFGNQHAGRQMKGDKWRRETRSGSDFGNQHAGRQMKKGD